MRVNVQILLLSISIYEQKVTLLHCWLWRVVLSNARSSLYRPWPWNWCGSSGTGDYGGVVDVGDRYRLVPAQALDWAVPAERMMVVVLVTSIVEGAVLAEIAARA